MYIVASLFNLYSDGIFGKALCIQVGMKVNIEPISAIRYAGETVIEENKLIIVVEEMGNISETKLTFFSSPKNGTGGLKLKYELIHEVSKTEYLGCWITDNLDPGLTILE